MIQAGNRSVGLLRRLFGGRPTESRPGHTFAVANVSPAWGRLSEWRSHHVVAAYAGGVVESCHRYHGRLVKPPRTAWWGWRLCLCHPLVETLYLAYTGHRPVVLSPDAVWLTLLQGLAMHVRENAQELRHHFVPHGDRLTLQVRRDDFHKGSPENPWPEVFAEFSGAIREHTGPAHRLLTAEFSTTGPVERAAGDVMLMSAMLPYFDYHVETLCGIPSITLEGTPDDWDQLLDRVEAWERFGLGWWLKHLIPILDQFAAAARGRVGRRFWRSIFGIDHLCSGEHFGGWLPCLFPYLTGSGESDRECAVYRHELRGWDHAGRYREQNFLFGPGRVPFVWEYRGCCFDMEFIGGLVGVHQDPGTGALSPEIGWAVREVPGGA